MRDLGSPYSRCLVVTIRLPQWFRNVLFSQLTRQMILMNMELDQTNTLEIQWNY